MCGRPPRPRSAKQQTRSAVTRRSSPSAESAPTITNFRSATLRSGSENATVVLLEKEKAMNNTKTPWDLDVRVRERNLRKAVLDEKDVEKYLKELPDQAANAENVTIAQPAVGGGAAAPGAGPSPSGPPSGNG